jgi:adenosylcobinamide-GDP ribazoletransferase
MNSFILALQFLTIIPVNFRVDLSASTFRRALIYFPLIGMLLGLILSFVAVLLSLRLDSLAVSCLVMVLLAILTGGLHLDGLADTFDALGSRKSKDEMLVIMRDSRIGAMGVITLVSVILLKVALFNTLPITSRNGALIAMCVISRFVMVVMMYIFPYARNEGKAKLFVDSKDKNVLLAASLIALILVYIFCSWRGVLLMLVVVVSLYFFVRYIAKKINGITGDVIGASCELSEVLFLLAVALRG